MQLNMSDEYHICEVTSKRNIESLCARCIAIAYYRAGRGSTGLGEGKWG